MLKNSVKKMSAELMNRKINKDMKRSTKEIG